MSQRKGSTRTYNGPGHVQRLAKELQKTFKLAYSVAVTKAKAMLGVV